ncbi:MAG: alpha-L-rhamnosidase N-terminal domain-containing protein, partial [Armatimonadota bacterium]
MQLQAGWIWAGRPHPNAYCYLRREFEMADAAALARLRVTADTSYQLWVNGRFVGRGPGPFVDQVRPVDEHDVAGLLRAGRNVICVLGHWWGVTSHSRPEGRAGVLAELRWEDLSGGTGTVGTDESWRAMPSEAWERDVPRRSGAVAWTEYYDARRAPVGWTRPHFDDSRWPAAVLVDVPERRLIPRMRPLLQESFVRATEIAGAWTAGDQAPEAGDEPELTAFLDEEPLEPLPGELPDHVTAALTRARPLELRPDEGLALTLDLGREIVGHLELGIEAPAGGRIDLCPAELLRHGRPWCLRKGCRYAQRYVTRAGRQQWQTFAWHGLRFLHAVFRGFDSPVTILRLGVRRREAELDWAARWRVADGETGEALNRIWEIGRHTLQVGTQEVHVDCPTREQAAYWGDATWIGLWTLWMTGDARHLRHLLLSAEPAQYEDGQLPASVFSSLGQVLFDYSLVMPWGLYAYWWNTGDLSVAMHLDAAVERVLDWYRERRGDSGLVELDAVAAHERGEGTLFIDHPGLGWHNFPHPGLERRGVSAGLNLFLLRALQCWSELLREMGEADRAAAAAQEARSLADTIEA